MQRKDFFNEWEPIQRDFGYSQAVEVGDTVYIAGTAALDAEFAPLHVGNFSEQMRVVYEKLGETLKHHSLDFSNVVREVIYVTDMSALIEALPFRKTFYGDGPYPSATAAEVRQLFFPELLIEVEMIAVRHK